MSPTPPVAPEQVGPEWVTTVLERSGVAQGAVVGSVTFGGEIGTGQAARSVRYHLEWDEPVGRPASLVGKFPSADRGAREVLEATGAYWKEWLFYSELACTVDVRVPRCHAAHFDDASSDFVLLMEDLRDSATGDQLDGLTTDQLARAVEQAARLHGPRFGDARLRTRLAAGPGASTLEDAGPFCQEMYEAVLPGFVERFGDIVDAEALEVVERAAPFVARWFRGTGTPATLVHQDFRADNLMFTRGPDVQCAVVDFQSLAAGVGATDIAYLVGGSLRDGSERASVERELLDRYGSSLVPYGIHASREELWSDYRYGSLWGVIMTVLSSIAAERTERGDLMFATMANRHAHHASELDALALLR